MIVFNTIRKLARKRKTGSTILMERGPDRRRKNLGRRIERRRNADRRKPDSGSKNYEFVGASHGGWTKVD